MVNDPSDRCNYEEAVEQGDAARLRQALVEYPMRNTHQLQAAKVCAGVLALADSKRLMPTFAGYPVFRINAGDRLILQAKEPMSDQQMQSLYDMAEKVGVKIIVISREMQLVGIEPNSG